MEQKEYNTPLLDSFEDEEQNNATLPETDTPKHYKDILFLFLFGVNVLSIVGVAFLFGIVALSSDGDEVIKVADNGKQYDQTAEFTPSVSILLGMVSTLLMGVVMTALWIFTLSRVASYVLNAIMISMILVPIIFGFGLFALGFFVFGATLIALSIFLLVFSLFIRPRMDFAATNLKVACASVLQMPSIFGYALLAVGVQVLFCIVWGMAVVGYATSNNQTTIHSHGLIYDLGECTTYVYSNTFDIASFGTLTCAGDTCRACVCDGTFVSNHSCVTPKLYGWTYTWLLLSLFWTSAVISNVVHCTTSAAVAKWWVVGYPSAMMVQEGFETATTTSLGSICLGSLLVAVIRTLRTLLYFASRQMEKKNGRSSGALRQLQSCCVGLLRYLLTVMDRLVVYFNRYALCFVAIYHSDFRTASVSASNLFRTRGWSTLLNDDIIDVVMNIGHVIIGTTSMSTGYIYGRLTGLGHAYTVLLTVFGFVAGYLLSIVALSTISSAVSTVYVCYVDNPHALQVRINFSLSVLKCVHFLKCLLIAFFLLFLHRFHTRRCTCLCPNAGRKCSQAPSKAKTTNPIKQITTMIRTSSQKALADLSPKKNKSTHLRRSLAFAALSVVSPSRHRHRHRHLWVCPLPTAVPPQLLQPPRATTVQDGAAPSLRRVSPSSLRYFPDPRAKIKAYPYRKQAARAPRQHRLFREEGTTGGSRM